MVSGMTRTRRAAPMAPDDRRRAILDAVVPVLLERGPQLTTREIADAAGVAEGTLFRVFEDKHELLLEACWHVMTPDRARTWMSEIDTSGSLEDTVRQIVSTMADGMDRVVRVMLAVRSLSEGSHHDGGHNRGRGPTREFFEESNRAVVESLTWALRPHRTELALPPERAALLVRALVTGATHPGGGDQHRPTVAEITQVLMAGIAVPGKSDQEKH